MTLQTNMSQRLNGVGGKWESQCPKPTNQPTNQPIVLSLSLSLNLSLFCSPLPLSLSLALPVSLLFALLSTHVSLNVVLLSFMSDQCVRTCCCSWCKDAVLCITIPRTTAIIVTRAVAQLVALHLLRRTIRVQLPLMAPLLMFICLFHSFHTTSFQALFVSLPRLHTLHAPFSFGFCVPFLFVFAFEVVRKRLNSSAKSIL